jgi:tRNA A58 N-methylase Trm61
MKIFEDLSDSKNMIFNVKKLLNVGVGLTLYGEKVERTDARGTSGRSSGFTLPKRVFTGERVNADICQ